MNLNEIISYGINGQIFHATTGATGVAIPVSNTTSPVFGIWNPAGSLINAVLLNLKLGYDETTGAAGTVLYNTVLNTGSSLATGAPISAFNAVTPTNGLIGQGKASGVRFCSAATTTIAAAGTVVGMAGFSQTAVTAATTGSPQWMLEDAINGKWIVPPGVFFYLTGSAALTSLSCLEMCWIELPVS